MEGSTNMESFFANASVCLGRIAKQKQEWKNRVKTNA
jgi:hypothetical protein